MTIPIMDVEHNARLRAYRQNVIDRAIHNSPPPMDDVGEDVNFMLNEKDPNGLQSSDPGAKLDANRVDLTYLPEQFPLACAAICRVAEYGEAKYSRGGWLHVPNGFMRYTKAMLRHLFDLSPQDNHPAYAVLKNQLGEHSGDAQVAWNAIARLELKLRGSKS